MKKLGLHAKCIVPNNNVNNKVLLQFFLLQQYFYRKDFNPFCKTENSSETFANALDAFIIAASAIPSPTNKRSTLWQTFAVEKLSGMKENTLTLAFETNASNSQSNSKLMNNPVDNIVYLKAQKKVYEYVFVDQLNGGSSWKSGLVGM